jgi:hypothetical protein
MARKIARPGDVWEIWQVREVGSAYAGSLKPRA